MIHSTLGRVHDIQYTGTDTWYKLHWDRYMIYSTLGQVHDIQYTGTGTWYTVHWDRYMIHSTLGQVHDIQYTGTGTWYTVHWERCMIYSTLGLVHDIQYTGTGTWNTVHSDRYLIYTYRAFLSPHSSCLRGYFTKTTHFLPCLIFFDRTHLPIKNPYISFQFHDLFILYGPLRRSLEDRLHEDGGADQDGVAGGRPQVRHQILQEQLLGRLQTGKKDMMKSLK